MRASIQVSIVLAALIAPLATQAETEGEHGPHHSTLFTTRRDRSGNLTTNRFVQIEPGLNYLDEHGLWVPTIERIELAQGGATAWTGPHKVSFAANLNVQGAVQIQLPDGKELVSHVHGLALTDVQSGRSILIAQTKNSEAWIYPPNEVVYHDAFEGLRADVRYRYTKLGIEQDIILREQPEVDVASIFPGRAIEDLQFEVWTEFTGSPAPDRQEGARIIEEGVDKNSGARKSLTLEGDETLGFGSMAMAQGKIYPVADADETLSLVTKHWIAIEGRSFLVEAVPIVRVDGALEALPPKQGGAMRGESLPRNQAILAVKPKVRGETGRPPAVRRASHEQEVAFVKTPGVVFDYQLVNSVANFTFRSDTTYYVTNAVTLSGTNTTFEGGTVIKFSNSPNASLIVDSPITWLGDFYQPIVLTAVDDHSVGEVLGTGALSGQYATVALELRAAAGGANLAHLRIANAKRAITLPSHTNHVISHIQVRDCLVGIGATNADFKLRNALFTGVLTNFAGTGSTGRIEHLTTSAASLFSTADYGSGSLFLTNSLLVAVSSTNPFTAQGSTRLSSSSGVFQTAGGGQFYLASGSPYRNAGLTTFDTKLREQLRRTTTQAPAPLSGTITLSTTLYPTAQRDTDTPDVGYHYPALDYLVSNLAVTNATLTLANGVALGLRGSTGPWLQPKSALRGAGLPGQLNVFVRSTAVQESTNAPSAGSGDVLVSTYSSAGVFSNAPVVDLSFTMFIANTPGGYHFYHAGSYQAAAISLQHSQLSGGWFYVETGTEAPLVTLNNNAHRRSQFWLQGVLGLSMRHQLGQLGAYDLWATSTNNSWEIADNAFDASPVSRNGAVMTNYANSYIGGGAVLTPTSGTNIVSSSFAYAQGALGMLYHGQTNLADRGSRTAGAAGLYHFTTTSNQVKETNSVVDIGFHLVAVDAAGKPFDSDGDGIPDYLEDGDGNGTKSGLESDWTIGSIPAGVLRLLTPTF